MKTAAAVVALALVTAACAVSSPGAADRDDDPGDEPIANDPPEPANVPGPDVVPAPTASCSTTTGDNLSTLACYVCKTACAGSRPSTCSGDGWPTLARACLAASTFEAQTVYRWSDTDGDDPQSEQAYLRPFVLLDYMRRLRNAASSNPARADATLTAQIDYLVAGTAHYAADASGPDARVWQTYFTRGDGVVRRFADGLTQAAYALYFLSVAEIYATAPATRDRYLALALAMDNAMERPAGNKTGGVRVESAVACGAAGLTGPCWYFHSRAPASQLVPGAALNQSLYALRTAEAELAELGAARWTSTAIDRAAWEDRLRDRIAAAISQWAYGAGNTAAAPSEPPNLAQHVIAVGGPQPYDWASYEFDFAAHVHANNASAAHVCNYHTVTLNNLAAIVDAVDPATGAATAYLGSDARRDRIVQARSQLLTYTRHGVPEARGVAGARATVYQWFQSEITPAIRTGEQGCGAAGTDGLEAFYPASRAILCRAFGGAANPALGAACE